MTEDRLTALVDDVMDGSVLYVDRRRRCESAIRAAISEATVAQDAENQRLFGKIDELESTLDDEEAAHSETLRLWKEALDRGNRLREVCASVLPRFIELRHYRYRHEGDAHAVDFLDAENALRAAIEQSGPTPQIG